MNMIQDRYTIDQCSHPTCIYNKNVTLSDPTQLVLECNSTRLRVQGYFTLKIDIVWYIVYIVW